MPLIDGNGVKWLVSLFKNYFGIRWSMNGDKNDLKISSGADLDNYTDIGNYYCETDSDASGISNSPVSTAFVLKVYSSAGYSPETSDTNYMIQHVEDPYDVTWIRYKTTGNWSDWYVLVYTEEGTIGSGTKPVYINNGVPTASTSTVGSGTQHMYLNSGTMTASSSTVGSGTKPIYLSSGTYTASSSTVGGTAKPMYLSSGTMTAITSTVGSGTKIVYLSSGTFTASSSTVGSSTLPMYLNSGTFTECAYKLK